MINQTEAMRLIEAARGDAVVIAAQQARLPWVEVSQTPDLDVPFAGCMSKGSSLALGLALAQRGRRTILLDADGSLLMNLGSLVTIVQQSPPNLYHFVLENGVYAGTGGQPVPGEGRFSFAGLAREAGYRASYEFDDLEEFATRLPEVLGQPGPVLACLHIEPEVEHRPIHLRPRIRRFNVVLPTLRRALVEEGAAGR